MLLFIVVVLLSEVADCARGRHYIVTSLLVEPYLMLNYGNHTGNGRYTGFIADLMYELAHTVGIEYRIHIVTDGAYGIQQKDGSWDGMVGELIRSEADIAAAPLYSTKLRRDVIDFSDPFLTIQATMLLATDHAPSLSTARDLIRQNTTLYGTLNSGILIHAFRHTNDTDYKKLFQNMLAFSPSVFTDNNYEGIERARKGGYAFILPNVIGDYIAQQLPCGLRTVDSFLLRAHYALAVPKGSYLLTDLNKGLEILRQKGMLKALYRKWWFENSQCDLLKSSSVVSYDQHFATSGAVSCLSTHICYTLLLMYIIKIFILIIR